MYRIFVDFDGTITRRDVGDSIFERFLPAELIDAGWHRNIIEEWKAGRVSSMECLARECAKTVVTKEELDVELDTHTLVPGFTNLNEYCRRKNIPLTILSDGLDYYIDYILAKNGMEATLFHANHMYFANGSIGVEFPYADKGCGRCGNCKRWHIESERKEWDKVVYIGDGYSDRFAVLSADIVFAHKDLAEFCGHRGIPYNPFGDFFGVIDYLESGIENI
ncbi:MAG: MtnX-like HAD-IB family phosphatase [Candidatus Latescibacterota bacterium]